MNAKQTALTAAVITGIGAIGLAAFTVTPDTIIQLTVGVAAFFASGLVLFVLLWTPWLRALPLERQCRAIWIASVSTGIIVCLLPLVTFMLKR